MSYWIRDDEIYIYTPSTGGSGLRVRCIEGPAKAQMRGILPATSGARTRGIYVGYLLNIKVNSVMT